MTTTPKRHHTVSSGYIGRFGRRGLVAAHDVAGGVVEIGPRAVGFQNDFWGPEELAVEVEQAFAKVENPVLRLLRHLAERWPLCSEDRAALAQFLAVHVIRTPAFGAFIRGGSDRALESAVREVAERHGVDESRVAAAARVLKGQRHHVNTLLGQIGRIGSMLCNMQWNLVQFDYDWLITSDQPVVMLPSGAGMLSPASSVPIAGFESIIEAFVTLDPRQLLLLTWADTPDRAEPLRGDRSQACSVNCAVRAQAMVEWVSHPGDTPPFHELPILEPKVHAISTDLLPGYTAEIAHSSRRRAAASQLMMRVIEGNEPRDRMTWVTVGESSAEH